MAPGPEKRASPRFSCLSRARIRRCTENLHAEAEYLDRSHRPRQLLTPENWTNEKRGMTSDPPAVDRLVRSIVAAVNPLRIILFGSAARGEFSPDSDIDFLVVMPEGVHRRQTAQFLYRQIKGMGVPFDILVATPGDLEKHKDNLGLIYRTIVREGREVYAA